jgi:Uma2 family endonuclease
MAVSKIWTADDLDSLPDDGNRYEVLDGELLVTPAPSLTHQEASLVLAHLLTDYLQRNRIGHAVVAPADVKFSPRRLVQPDVFVTPLAKGRRPRLFSDVGRLLLAVEVTSPSTARADRVKKRAAYRDEKVPEYWIIDVDAGTIERTTPADTRVEVLSEQITWLPEGATEPLVIDLTAYFRRVLDE